MSKITGKDYLNVELYYEQESWIRQLPENGQRCRHLIEPFCVD